MSWFLLLFATGVAAGMTGALLGLGGGILIVPILTLGFHVPARLAIGTSLVCVATTSAGVGSVFRKGGNADIGLALRLEVATAAGAVAGGLIGSMLSARVLSVLFASVLFATVVYTVIKSRRAKEESVLATTSYVPKRWGLAYAVSSVAGMVSGLLGIGGGVIKVPTMYVIMGVPFGVATATSNFMVGITAAAGLFVYLGRGDVRPVLTAVTASGVLIGAVSGALLQPKVKVSVLRWALMVVLVVVGIQILVKGF